MRRVAMAAALGAALVLAGCGEAEEPKTPSSDRGELVLDMPDGYDETYELYRRCDGTTGIYTFKDYYGWDFQVVPGDPKCAVAK